MGVNKLMIRFELLIKYLVFVKNNLTFDFQLLKV